jgi:predicted TIM-barrel fold metal-dependent hydrolase
MASKYRIVDVDAHYTDDPRELWKYMEEPWATRIRDWSGKYYAPPGGAATGDSMMGGRVQTHKHKKGLVKEHQGISSNKEVVKEVMNEYNFSEIVLIPTYLLHLAKMNDRQKAVVLAKAHALHMIDSVVDPDQGIYAALPVPIQDPIASKELIEQVGDHPGFCGILIATQGPVPPLGSVAYDPIYKAAQEKNLPIICHSGFSGPDNNTYAHGLEKWVESHTLDFAFSNMIQLTSIVMQGVRERFPKLHFIFQESGVFWIPQVMFRLDSEYMRRKSEVPLLKKLPSEYIKEMHFGTQPIEICKPEYLKYVFEMIDGENTLMYASDWPHYDWDHPSIIERMTFLSHEAKQKILGDNARRVLRFQTSVIPAQNK